jgi:hypothetical protein
MLRSASGVMTPPLRKAPWVTGAGIPPAPGHSAMVTDVSNLAWPQAMATERVVHLRCVGKSALSCASRRPTTSPALPNPASAASSCLPSRGCRRPGPSALRARYQAIAAVTTALLLLGCGEAGDQPSAPAPSSDPGVIHIHGLGRNPADDALFIATHTGLFRMGSNDRSPERVADLYQDTMGFAVIGRDHFLGSGHPGSIENDPPFLGLIESRNAGNTWRPISLRGDVDFHVLEAQGNTVYGFGSDWDTREARFLRSDDNGRTWTRLTPPEGLLGLAIDPHDSRAIVALGEQRGWVSRDGGASWRRLPIPGGMVTWTRELGLIAVDLGGVIRTASEPTGEWDEVGRLPGPPAALEGVGDELLAATHESQVISSTDGGYTWRDLLTG